MRCDKCDSVMLLPCRAGLLRAARPPLRRCARAYAAKSDDLASLEKELARHDNLYYNQAKPELTDERTTRSRGK